MKFTYHKLRLALGLVVFSIGVILFFPHTLLFYKLMAGSAWLLIGALLCFYPKFDLKLTDNWLTRAFGFFLIFAGLLFTAVAVLALCQPKPRPHGLLPFYECIGIGPALIVTGFLICFHWPNKG